MINAKLMRMQFLLILFLFCAINHTYSQHQGYKFQHLGIDQGLSVNTVTDIIKDHQGFMWFATPDGLNRYDGYTFKHYKNDPKDARSLSSSQISVLFEDSHKTLWVGTLGGGLGRYNREKDSFRFFVQNEQDAHSLSNNEVTEIYEDKSGNLWIGTFWGLNLYNKEKENFIKIHGAQDANTLTSSSISSIVEDHKGNLWIATHEDGLNLLNQEDFTSKRFKHNPKDNNSLSDNFINVLCVDKNGKLWIGTHKNGIDLFDPDNETFTNFQHDPADYNSISGNNVLCIEEDKKGNIWIGTEGTGLNFFNVKEQIFYDFWTNLSVSGSLKSNTILSLFYDNAGILWIGTTSGGINMLDRNLPAFDHFITNTGTHSINGFAEDENEKIWVATDGNGIDIVNKYNHEVSHIRQDMTDNTLSTNGITAIISDRKWDMWMGTYGGGLNHLNRKTGKFTHYFQGEGDLQLSNNSIFTLLEDKNDNIWIGTLGGGVNILNKERDKITRLIHDPADLKGLSSNYISCLLEDKNGDIWIGSYSRGLNLYDKKKKTFKVFNEVSGYKGIDKISSLYEDIDGNLWIGTFGGGIVFFNTKEHRFTAYREDEGLANDVVNGIQPDSKGNLWISTNKGLSKFNLEKKTFKNFDTEDGLQSYEFRKGASFRTINGEVLFGGINGFNFFHPDSIHDNPYIPEIVFTDFQIFNKPVIVRATNSPLQKPISVSEELILSYKHSVFTIEFSALNFTLPRKNQYAYILEGFEKEWNHVGAQRKATYTNLDPGTYTFKVKASNNDLLWNPEETTLRITITPPFWKTWWFIALSILLFILTIAGFITIRINRIRKQKDELEKQVVERTLKISIQNEELETQSNILKAANLSIHEKEQKLHDLYTEMKDSIRAAEAIQKHMLPSDEWDKTLGVESFVLFKPKDVVSGDFYWCGTKNNLRIFAAVDCTGHGVSGAFMAINAHHLLNKVIFEQGENINAAEILDKLNEAVIKEVYQPKSNTELHYGMELAICILDEDNKKLQFAGANFPLYLLRDGEILITKGDRVSIGGGKGVRFTNHEFELQEDDMIYVFSDGYADQIGGESGSQKLMYPRFRNLLATLGHHDVTHQAEILEKELELWKGSEEQIDDILVIGVKIK